MSAARTGCLLPRSIPSIIFPSNTPLLLFTHTRTHKHARTRACVCVCVCVRGYLADTLSQPPPHACWCQGIWERRIVCVVGDDASARRKLQNPPLQNPALIKPPPLHPDQWRKMHQRARSFSCEKNQFMHIIFFCKLKKIAIAKNCFILILNI